MADNKNVEAVTEEKVEDVKVEETKVEDKKTEEKEEKKTQPSAKTETKKEEPKKEEKKPEVVKAEEIKDGRHGVLTTKHNFAPGDKVWVAGFEKNRDTAGFTRLVNSFRFIPVAGEIEKIMITDKVRYKFKNVAGSNYDEEDIRWTEKEAKELCDKKNNRYN